MTKALQKQRGTITTENLVDAGASTVGGSVEIDVGTAGACMVQVTGTYTASGGLSGQITLDNGAWVTMGASTTFKRMSTGVQTAAITSGEQDIYQVALAGAQRFRVTALGAVTGTATVSILPAELSLGSSSSGGGGGDATAANQTTQITAEQAIQATLGATTGAAIVTDVDGTIQRYLRGMVTLMAGTDAQLPATLGSKTTSGSLATVGGPLEFAVVGSTVTRPANTTAYAANDAVSDNATAGSVTPITFTLADFNDMPLTLTRCRIHTTDTGFVAASFAIYLYQTDPTASSGVVGGDNAAFSTKKGTFIGRMSGAFRTFSDGAVCCLTPDEGGYIIAMPTTGAKTIFGLLQTLSAATPSANSTTFIPTLEGFQGRA